MIYRKTFIMNLAIFISWVLLVSVGIYWTWNPLQHYEISILSSTVLAFYLAMIFTPAISSLAILKQTNQKLCLTALTLNFIIVIVLSSIFLYLQTLPNNMIRKMNEPPIIVLLLISALPASISIKSLIKLLKNEE